MADMSAGPDERGRDWRGAPPSGERRAADRYAADDAKRRLGRFLLGNPRTIAGAVYGTIVVLSVLTAGIAGIVIVAAPDIGFATLALLVGISFIANGVVMMILGRQMREIKRETAIASQHAGAAI
jgi:hypothetical protein